MKSKIAILLMPFIHSLYFKENLMKSKIAMFWPWVENYAGEVNESSSMSVGGIFARAWINSDLKAEILGQ